MTVVIDHSVAEHSIKPGNCFFILDLCPPLQSAHKRGLEDIFGGSSRSDALFEKRQKLPVSCNQSGNRIGR